MCSLSQCAVASRRELATGLFVAALALHYAHGGGAHGDAAAHAHAKLVPEVRRDAREDERTWHMRGGNKLRFIPPLNKRWSYGFHT